MKRLLALLLSVLLVTQMAPAVFAQANAEVTLSSASAACGENVTVTVSIQNCVDVKSIYIVPLYDEEALEIVSGTWLVSGMLADDWSEAFGDAAIAFSSNTNVNTDIFEFVFKVKENAQAGKAAKVSCEIVIKTMQGKDEVPVFVTVTEGGVTVPAAQCTHPNKTEVPSKSPDCIHPGNNRYYICDDCSLVLQADGITETTVEAETIAALEHDYRSVVTLPTCTEKGYITHTCTRCGDSYVDSDADALGHSYSYEVTREPTAEAEGIVTHTCTRCGDTVTATVPKLNKTDYTCEVIKEPTGGEPGILRYTIVTQYGTFTFDVPLEERAEVMLGDINGDGKITVTDLMCLANHLAGKAEINEANSELDGNGKVNVTDLMRLANFFAGKATLN